MTKIWLITGVGSGLGQAMASAALRRGDTVLGIVRKAEAARAFEASVPGRAHAIVADVIDRTLLFKLIEEAIARVGTIDIVVNNVGQVLDSYVEEGEPDAVRALFEVNFIGALNVIQAVLPHFRQRGEGRIFNISSGGGIAAVPSLGFYCATKFALEGLSEALRAEVGPLGIAVTIVEPGAFRTNLLIHSKTSIDREIPDYERSVGKIRRQLDALGGQEPGDPEKLALAMLVLADAEAPPMRAAFGDDAIGMALGKADSIRSDVEAWRSVGSGLAFDSP
jgi:NAD(P)-dependent dehydrogenase (short-subunit alcohol dehydrogenase family)